MKIFGSISELVDLAFRLAGGKQVKLKANTQTTSGTLVTVNVPDVAATGDTQNMILTAATQTLSNKTLGSGTAITAGTINGTVIGGSTPAAGTFTDIVGSTLDINTSAELQTLTIPSMVTAGILHNNSSGAVSSSLIVNADVDAGAALAFSKLATLASGNILIGSNTGVVTSRSMSGDVTIDNLGATTIGASKVLNTMLAGSIDRSKLSSGTNYRILANNASGVMSENAALTANEAVATDANGQLVSVTGVSATELGYLSGVTSDVQTQIGNKQDLDATLTTIAALTPTTDQYIYFSGADTAATGTITSFGRSLIDDADAATSRSTLGLGSMATQAASSVAITGGTVRGVSLDRLAVESDTAPVSSGVLTPTKGLMIITAGDNTLNTITPAVGFGLVNGAVVTLINNEGADITVTNAGNIQTGTGADFTLKQGAASSFIYSSTLSKYVLSGGAGGSGGLATTYAAAGGITAVNNTHYLTNLSASGQTITLPFGTNGAVIRFSDAGEKWDVYPLTIAPATGQRIDNLVLNETLVCDVKRGWVELSYNTSFDGWALMSLASSSASASGSGEVSAVLNASAASDTTGWTGATRVTSGSPLDPIVTTALSIANAAGAESSTSGGYYSISSLAPGLKSKKLKVSFYFSTPATDVYRVSVYAGSTRLALSSDSAGATSLPANVTGGYFEASFDSSTASAYSLNITRTSGSTGACTITQVIVGPGINAQGAAVSAWRASTTPGSGWFVTGPTNVTTTVREMREGSNLRLRGSIVATGTSAAFAELEFRLPTGYTLDTTVAAASSTNRIPVGRFDLLKSGSSSAAGICYMVGTGSFVLRYTNDANVQPGSVSEATPIAWNTTTNATSLSFDITVPLSEWAGNGTVNLGAGAQVEYASNGSTATAADDTTTFQYGPSGALIQNITAALKRRVRFQYPIQTDDIVLLEVSDDRAKWTEVTGWGLNGAGTVRSMEYLLANGKSYGLGSLSLVNTTDVDVYFGTYATIDTASATYGANGTAWSSGAGSFYWRVRKAKASAPVGFGVASTNDSGLVRAYSAMTKIRLNTGNGHGSTNTKIRRFTTAVVNTGTGITYADSATLGASFTCTEAGIYSFSYSDAFSAANDLGLSLNSTQLTTNIGSITAADKLIHTGITAADFFNTVSITIHLAVGDVVRPHTSGGAESTVPGRVSFSVQRIV